MGKNKSKKKPKTEFQIWAGVFAKLDKELKEAKRLHKLSIGKNAD